MRVLLTTYRSRGEVDRCDIEPMVGVAIKLGALDAAGVTPAGAWR